MSATPDSTLANPEQVIANLRRELDECRAEQDKAQRNLNETATERDEALARETATAEVLQVINSSRGNPAPVFAAMLEKAAGLCGAAHGNLWTYDGERFHPAATHGSPRFAEWVRQREAFLPEPGSTNQRILQGESVIEIPDLARDPASKPDNRHRRALIEIGGFRTSLSIALRKEQTLLGVLHIFRQEVRPFTDKQISLVQNFAAQAVIAMENARLLTETREALEQQTATAEVLQVINSSPGDLAPVFDAMLDKALTLCGAALGYMLSCDGDVFRRVASRGFSSALEAALPPPGPTPGSLAERFVRGEKIIRATNLMEAEAYRVGAPAARALVDVGGVRSYVAIALRKGDRLLGVIAIYRQEVRPFTDKQIALLQNFSAHAVIAMENARLLTETREALEQQTATAEVLQVINSSPGDLAPVFDAILEKARTLCGAALGDLMIFDGEQFHQVAVRAAPRFAEYWRQNPLRPPLEGDGPLSRLMRGECLVHLPDVRESDAYRNIPEYRRRMDLGGIRTLLAVPLLKDGGDMIGVINIYRQDMRPFSDKQIALLQNFAAQAVIAMENARLLGELRQRTEDLQESLEYQTATSDVLNVINRSAFDLGTVLQTVATTAVRLCRADSATIYRNEGGEYRWAAGHMLVPEYKEIERNLRIRPGIGTVVGRCVLAGGTVQILDAWADPLYEAKEDARIGGVRTMIGVPLLREGTPIGAIGLARRRIEAFSEREIQLVSTFAAQAVIAMENARLLTETREALEQQTATAEVLQVINSSPGDLGPVFQAMLQKAHTLCEASFGALMTYDGERFHAVAHQGTPTPFREFLGSGIRPGPGDPFGRMVEGAALSHIHDLSEVAERYPGESLPRAAVNLGRIRTFLVVPLRKDSALLGVITAYRQEVRPFSEKQIALLQNFAAQAVIAIDNARLLNEIRQRQAELSVTFDNMGDGVAMFDAGLRLGAWNMNFQQLLDLPDAFLAERPHYETYVHYLANRGEFGSEALEAELSRRLEHTEQELRFERIRPDGQVIEVRRNAVPGGGFVLIYSDITERKRSEAEIRAARDAAEAAYRELKAAQANLIHAEKMASLGQLTAGIAHEIKNPLNFVNNFAGLSVELLDELKEAAAPAVVSLGDDERAEIDELVATISGNLDKIAEHGRRADGIVSSMLEHSRGSSGECRRIDLNALVEEALNLAYHGGRAQDQSFNITLERDYADTIFPIELVPQDITRVCLNLFGNGFYAATKRQKDGGDPNFRPTLKVSTRDLGEAVEIRVRDNGIGIPPEIKDKLFQPFFTTKPTGEGTGLGLSISYDIVTQQHGGTIEVDSGFGEFTEFTIRLPRTHRTAAEAAS